ncbi:hypothetical protein CMK10_03950 [Candidatus Poribacteria bacterium]|nr:hypothetical protein [Candidatus Poribacteria bacterium]MAT74590.1 hypothetical protein [Candidatus Poribacteria bacterium]
MSPLRIGLECYGQYVMAVHKVEDKVEMTFWLNTGGWKRIAAGQYPMHKFGNGIIMLPHMMEKKPNFILMANQLVYRN